MTSEELENIVSRHEMQRLELKESFGAECIETACAFTNSQGGFILIGVDNDGNPSKHQLRFEGLRDYENKISTATEPSVAVVAEKVGFRGREVVVLKVSENPLKPVAYKGRCYIRKGSVKPDDAGGDCRVSFEVNRREHGCGIHAGRDEGRSEHGCRAQVHAPVCREKEARIF